MQNQSKSLQRKMTIYLITLIILFGCVVTIASYYLTSQNLLRQAKEDLGNDVQSQTHESYQLLRHARDLAHIISIQPRLINYFDKSFTGEILIPDADYLESYNVGEMFSSIYIIDNTGTTLYATDPRFVNQNYSSQDYFVKSIDNHSFFQVSVGATTNEFGYYFSSPIVVKNEVRGVVVIKMKPDFLHNILNAHASKTNIITLVDQYGLIINSSDISQIGKSLGSLTDSDIASLVRNRLITEKPISLDYIVIQKDLSVMNDNSKIYDFSENIKKTNQVLAAAKITDFPLFIINEVDSSVFSQPATNASVVIATIVMLTAIIAVAIVSQIVARFLKPIQILHSYANEIGQGNYTRDKLQINTGDELEDLSHTLEKMAKNVKNSYELVESKVVQRTSELSKINSLMIDREVKMIELKKEIAALKGKKQYGT